MGKINAVIKGIGAYLPEYVLTNDELSRMVDTSDEWIMSRIGIKERRILKDPNLGSSYMGTKAVEELFGVTVKKVNTMNVKPKKKRVRYVPGLTRQWKKAMVTIAEGETIEIFAS
jgi:hypothetical protein